MHVFKDSMWWVEEEIFWVCTWTKQGPNGYYYGMSHIFVRNIYNFERDYASMSHNSCIYTVYPLVFISSLTSCRFTRKQWGNARSTSPALCSALFLDSGTRKTQTKGTCSEGYKPDSKPRPAMPAGLSKLLVFTFTVFIGDRIRYS
jgi:hypothetical protein